MTPARLPAPGYYSYAGLGGTDVVDFYGPITVSANEIIHVEMNPGYSPTTGKNYDLKLYYGCPGSVVASSNYPGISMESINHVAAVPGDYYYAVHVVSGSGGYDHTAWVANQAPSTCGDSTLVGLDSTIFASCSFTSPVCGSSPCSYAISMGVSGKGTVAGRMIIGGSTVLECGPVSGGGGILNCGDNSLSFPSGTFTALCESYNPGLDAAAAAQVTISCGAAI